MTGFNEDFAASLRGERGYRGVDPPIAAGLFRLGLITEKQAWEAAKEYEADWNTAWDDSNWWFKTAELAWHNTASFWARLFSAGVPSVSWQSKWIKEHRGW